MANITYMTIAYDSDDYRKALGLRERILRHSIGATFSAEEIESERDMIQFVAKQDGAICATAVMAPEENCYKIQRVAVDESLQGQGIGAELMRFCENYAKEYDVYHLYCHARSTAAQFYVQNDWTIDGPEFDEDGVPHQKLWKQLAE